MHQLELLVDAGAQLRLLGTCRASFTDRLDRNQVELLPLPDSLDATVSGMLAQRHGLTHLATICRGVPVFAAFLCFLKDRGDAAALEALRHLQDFGRWLLTHVSQWPAGQLGDAGRPTLAHMTELLVNLPCGTSALQGLMDARAGLTVVRDQLLADGWLEFDLDAGEGEAYAAVHDVLADGALLQWLQTVRPPAAEEALLRWLQTALRTGNFGSVLRALQRVSNGSTTPATGHTGVTPFCWQA
jgi:hypothetical protein